LVKSLGWPSLTSRRAAGYARFLDLLTSASRRTTVSTFTLDEDAIVSRSMQLDEIPRARLSTVAREPFEDARVFADEALSLDPVAFDAFQGDGMGGVRTQRSPADARSRHRSRHPGAPGPSARRTYPRLSFGLRPARPQARGRARG
jgi:hypothetical protein